MGVELIDDGNQAVMICNTSMCPFGVVMDSKYATDFLEEQGDLRSLAYEEIEDLYNEFVTKLEGK